MRCAALLFVFCAAASQRVMATDVWSISSGVNYTSGRYRADERTTMVYAPIGLRYKSNSHGASIVLPYVRVTGPINVLNADGSETRVRTVREGVGDVQLAASAALVNDRPRALRLDIVGRIKFATADHQKRLGTGANDYALYADATKGFARSFAFARFGYDDRGKPKFLYEGNLNNLWFGHLGGGYRLSDRWSAGLVGSFSSPPLTDRSPQALLGSFATVRYGYWTIQASAFRGFSKSGPDWGGGLLISLDLK